ncbi:hypothetical protein F6T13_21140 [Escherichia coli]|nr:hypothetical protein [Escherichia coli]EGF7412906.1 hypothetical protein [Escherichia coli]EGF7454054.1 hypothetical protein [Escherichia coli]
MMKRSTTRRYLTVLMIGFSMSNMIYANEPMRQIEFAPIGEIRPQWEDKGGGQNGIMMVSGVLLSSPCKLESNEVDLGDIQRRKEKSERYVLTLNLRGCADGDIAKQEGSRPIVITQVAVLNRGKEGVLQLDQNTISNGKVAIHDGDNKLIYNLKKNQYQSLIKHTYSEQELVGSYASRMLLHLMLGYE